MKLWKENKIANEYEMSHDEVVALFKTSRYYAAWEEENYNLRYQLTLFIGAKDGLNSSLDDNPEKDLRIIENEILR